MINNFNLELVMNNSCNKNCSYCYENNKGDNFMSLELASEVIDKAMMHVKFGKNVMFFGGEPTMSIDVIKSIYDKYKDNLEFSIITNGFFLKYENRHTDFMRNFRDVNISLEGTEKAFNEIRSEKGLISKIDTLHQLGWNNICINISVNGLLCGNEEEFVSNIKYIESKGMYAHLYNIKSEDSTFKSVEEYITFMYKIKDLDMKIFRKLLLIQSDDVRYEDNDVDFLCTYNDRLSIDPNGFIKSCVRMVDEDNDMNIKNVDNVEDLYKRFAYNVAKSHKSLYEGCSNCDVPLGFCQVSCKAMIDDLLKRGKIDNLDMLCKMENVRHLMRKEIIDL